ncbi:hypothetical protein DSCA_20390 [Desulfosarcina alkanivorans]|uniref:histidine kinase n=1 Tax=Desulfosarcina alkanivorans TaxID=571177 RepID=A0A5K7YJT7_9BACT|nr:PAS domain S-box protein [Desulfosarcina alkanivorans]BBO68109.1 hypothetical protein DSCA_20390 [Desulfosarcina alkanivorans]
MDPRKCSNQGTNDEAETGLAQYCLDQASVCFFRHDAEGRFLHVNQKACESLGYSLTELIDMSVYDINPTVTSENWPNLWQRMCDARSITFEAIHRRKDGTTFPVEITANLIEHNNHRFAISFVQDITERKRVEEKLRLTQFSFDRASIGIFRSGMDARILNANEQACKSLGYSCEELARMTIFDIDPTVSQEVWNDLWQKTCEKVTINFETTHRRKDGTTFPVDITANLLEFEGSKYSISFVRDITEKKENEKQKAIMEAHLHQAQRMEAIGTLAGGIAHDFNNILSAIYGYTQLAQLRCAGGSKLREFIDQIGLASDRAKDLVQQILAFSRQGKSEKMPIDIGSVAKDAIKLIRATIPTTIEIRQTIKPKLGAVFADETQIHQIIMNLCTNAYHAMQKKGGLLEVDIVPVAINTQDSSNYPDMDPGKYLKLIVSDTGDGMDQDTLARIFEPYFTTKRSGEGTGMGLSTVHGIVKDHGGCIKAYSEPGVGTTFQIFLPLVETVPQGSTPEEGPLASGEECILLVDDEKLLIEIGKELLEALGYHVETRTSPIDAIEAFRVNPEKYQLVISDMTMPKMTGLKMAQRIKTIRPEIPIIICTGFSTTISTDTLAQSGINEVLMKPVTLHELSSTVRNVLDETRRMTVSPNREDADHAAAER